MESERNKRKNKHYLQNSGIINPTLEGKDRNPGYAEEPVLFASYSFFI
jgi:hypothetical protein